MTQNKNILSIQNLTVEIRNKEASIYPVINASIDFKLGETIAIVGESGSGKTILTQSILQLLPRSKISYSGKIIFNGQNLLDLNEKKLRNIRGGDISVIFQDPQSALNPTMTVGNQIVENILQHTSKNYIEAYNETIALMKEVGMSSPQQRFHQYPHELSGGLRQRVMIAISISCKPKILIADEPTTSLDVTIQAQILDLLTTLQKKENMTIIIISHDLAVVAGIADKIAVMYAGELVEYNTVNEIFEHPRHPYTQALLRTIPNMKYTRRKALKPIPGSIPKSNILQSNCVFSDRCDYTMSVCQTVHPKKYGSHLRYSQCHLHHPYASKQWKRFTNHYPAYKRSIA